MRNEKDAMEQFLVLSVVLTGFKRADLLGTGLTRRYYEEVVGIVGETIGGELWSAANDVVKRYGENLAALEEAVRKEILNDVKLGPVARNVITLWYLGNWAQLPQDWRNRYGANEKDADHVVSAQAYQEGLVWRTIGAHPPGAKQPGFGTWGFPPQVEWD